MPHLIGINMNDINTNDQSWHKHECAKVGMNYCATNTMCHIWCNVLFGFSIVAIVHIVCAIFGIMATIVPHLTHS